MISIIVPIYQVEPYLHKCVESILNQTYRDLEILLIDDGSPDRCGEICDEYGKTDSRVRVFHTENRGVAAARNLGLREARGDFIGFVDPDDWIDPEMYAVLLHRLEETGADISVCKWRNEYRNGSNEAKGVSDQVLTGDELLEAHVFATIENYLCDKLFRREMWDNISFPVGRSFEDIAITYKTILRAEKVAGVSRCMYHYCHRSGSIGTTQTMNNLIDFWKAFYERCTGLINVPEIKRNSKMVNKLREQIANGAAKTWWWVYKVPEDQRDTAYLKAVSGYVRENFPLFGYAGWRPHVRISVFLARYPNNFSYAVGYCLCCFFQMTRNRRRL